MLCQGTVKSDNLERNVMSSVRELCLRYKPWLLHRDKNPKQLKAPRINESEWMGPDRYPNELL